MYEVRVQARFNALHQLRLYDGTVEPLHGHDWKVEAVFRGPELDRIQVLVDFVSAEARLREVVKPFDHAGLNEITAREGANPSAEWVARYVFDRLRERLEPGCPLVAVYVEEAPGCIAGYLRPQGPADTSSMA